MIEKPKPSQEPVTVGSELIEGLGDDETMGPMHHEYCNMTMLGRECDCGLQELYIEIKDLAFMVRRFVRAIRKVDPENKMAEQAIDYLVRHKLHGCILRDDA